MGSYKPCTHPHPPTLTDSHPHPAIKRSHSPTPNHTQTKRSHTNPHAPTLTHIHLIKGHTHPHPTRKRTYPPKFSRKCREKKIFHYPLGNQICQKLKKSSMPTDQ